MIVLKSVLYKIRKRDILPLFFVLVTFFISGNLHAQQIRDLYIVSIGEALDDTVAYNQLLKKIKRFNINSITINDFIKYQRHSGINQLFNDVRNLGVRYFSSGFPVEYFTDPRYSDKAFDGYIRNYTYEREWWNDTTKGADPMKELKRLEMLKRRNGVSMRVYFGWFGEEASAEQIAYLTVRNFDQILIHHYRTKADYNYIRARLLAFAKAAQRSGKQQEVLIRFSAEKQFMDGIGPAMVQDFYTELEKAFEEDKKVNNELRHIHLKGYQIYQDQLLEPKPKN